MIDWLEKNRYFAVIMALLIAIIIFLVSSIPGEGLPSAGNLNLSIAYHLAVFFLLNFFLLISLNGENKIKTRRVVIVLLISIAYAILDEIHQFFVPLRHPSILDVLIDSMGISFSAFIYIYAKKDKERSKL